MFYDYHRASNTVYNNNIITTHQRQHTCIIQHRASRIIIIKLLLLGTYVIGAEMSGHNVRVWYTRWTSRYRKRMYVRIYYI